MRYFEGASPLHAYDAAGWRLVFEMSGVLTESGLELKPGVRMVHEAPHADHYVPIASGEVLRRIAEVLDSCAQAGQENRPLRGTAGNFRLVLEPNSDEVGLWFYARYTNGLWSGIVEVTVPNDAFTYWVAAESTLADGTKLETVVVISNGGASTEGFYWFHEGNWYRQDDADFLTSTGKLKADFFPFDWSYKIPVPNDPFHPPGDEVPEDIEE